MMIAEIARIAHEANRAYCACVGDDSQVSWADAPAWQRNPALRNVQDIVSGRITSAEQSHAGWLAAKIADGWVYGPAKDASRKTHPCILSHAELPAVEKVKGVLFFSIVRALSHD